MAKAKKTKLKSQISDVDFIKNGRYTYTPRPKYTHNFKKDGPPKLDTDEQQDIVFNRNVEVNYNNEVRKYSPIEYLENHIENWYKVVDEAKGYKEALSILANAELKTKRLIREWNLKEFGFNVDDIVEDLRDVINYQRRQYEAGYFNSSAGIQNKITNSIVFKIGMLFATGQAQKEMDLLGAQEAAIKLGFKKTDRNYFTYTRDNRVNTRNIYSNIRLMTAIKDECSRMEIETCKDFNEAYKKLLSLIQ